MENYNPFVTAIKRKSLSNPIKLLLDKGLLNGKILDFGCGHGLDKEYLKNKFNIHNYDKYNLIYKKDDLLSDRYDVVYTSFVFNVIVEWDEFYDTLKIIRNLSNNIYVAVRSDVEAVKKHWKYDERLKGYWTNKSFQRFFTKEMVMECFGEVTFISTNKSFILFKLNQVLN